MLIDAPALAAGWGGDTKLAYTNPRFGRGGPIMLMDAAAFIALFGCAYIICC